MRNSQNFMMCWTRVGQGEPISLAPLLLPAVVYNELNRSGNGKCQCQFLFLHLFIGQKKKSSSLSVLHKLTSNVMSKL